MSYYVPPCKRNTTNSSSTTNTSNTTNQKKPFRGNNIKKRENDSQVNLSYINKKEIEDLEVNTIEEGTVLKISDTTIFVNLKNYIYKNKNYSATIYNKSGVTLNYKINQKVLVKIVDKVYDSNKKIYFIKLKQVLHKNILILDLNGILLRRIRNDEECIDEIYPHFDSFLKYCCDKFHLILWSCCRRNNIDFKLFEKYEIMRILDQDHVENCYPRHSVVSKEKPLFLKNISKIEELFCDIYLKNRVLFVDDHIEKFEKNLSGTSLIFGEKDTETFLNENGLLRTILSKYESTENIVEISNSLKDTGFNQFINFSGVLEIDKDIFPSIRAQNLHRTDFYQVLDDNYLVCEKTDGIRFLLYIINERIFLIDRSRKMFELQNSDSNNFFDIFGSDTRIDGELVLKYTGNTSQLIFLIFDVICINGVDSEQDETIQFSNNDSCTSSSSSICSGLNYRIEK